MCRISNNLGTAFAVIHVSAGMSNRRILFFVSLFVVHFFFSLF
ncbi:hypothetical protein NECAME_18965 [Necator americanus]|uniref:Uncharacterized protein n=1 Tax=Necator americanus TaxID=51031 RepID=W2STQ1_NECAM|nr:hypothetical protein NECAME_18965 [Necator americanus]ETN72216.1 hypothetical protein NECAME_18965 [Necator americanus]